MFHKVQVRAGKPIRCKIRNGVLLFNTDSTQLNGFSMRPEKLDGFGTQFGIIIAAHIDETTIQLTLEPDTEVPTKLRTRNAEVDIREIPHEYVSATWLQAGKKLAEVYP